MAAAVLGGPAGKAYVICPPEVPCAVRSDKLLRLTDSIAHNVLLTRYYCRCREGICTMLELIQAYAELITSCV